MTWIEGVSLGGVVAVIGLVFAVGIWKGKVDSDRTNFKDFMKEVRDDIKTILSRLQTPEATRSSPLRLTDFGKDLS